MTPLLLCFTLWRGVTDMSYDPKICRPGCLMQSRVEWDQIYRSGAFVPGLSVQSRSIGENGRCVASVGTP